VTLIRSNGWRCLCDGANNGRGEAQLDFVVANGMKQSARRNLNKMEFVPASHANTMKQGPMARILLFCRRVDRSVFIWMKQLMQVTRLGTACAVKQE